MAAPSLAPRLTDRLEAIKTHSRRDGGVLIDAFEADWRKRWLVERGVEIISEASRHLTDELKARHPEIPWTKVAGSETCSATNTKRLRRRSCRSWCRTI